MLPIRPGSARALAQSAIQKGVREGLSAARIFDALRSGIGTYRRTDFLADVRRELGRERLVDPLRSVRRDRMPSESLMTASRRRQSNRYLYTVEVKVAGQLDPEWRSVSSPYRLSRAEAETLAVRTRRTEQTPPLRGVTSASLRYADVDAGRAIERR